MKIFLLGCGAQKAGTTWLAKNLNYSSEYWDGGIKEWRFWKHYFNTDSRLLQLHKMKKMLQETSSNTRLDKRKIKWRISSLQKPELFLNNINNNLSKTINIKVLGDMTPLNGTLSISELTYIKKYFHSKGMIVKLLLIMRDPVERIFSAVKMKTTNNAPEQYKKMSNLC